MISVSLQKSSRLFVAVVLFAFRKNPLTVGFMAEPSFRRLSTMATIVQRGKKFAVVYDYTTAAGEKKTKMGIRVKQGTSKRAQG